MTDQALIDHLIEIKEGQAALKAKVDSIEHAVLGDGQPGLAQKVEALEASKNRIWGIGGAIGFFLTALEAWFHWPGKH